MKKTIKNVLLIIWVLISLKIIWLSGPYTLGFILSIFVKIFHIPNGNLYISYFLAFTEKEYVLGSVFSQYSLLPFLRGFSDLLLCLFVVNSWIFYLLYKKTELNFKDRTSNIVSFILIILYLWFIKDVIEIFYFKEIIIDLKETFFLKIFYSISLFIVIFNIMSILLISKNFFLPLYKRIFFACFLIFVSGHFLQVTIFALIWDEGALNFLFNNLDFSTFKGPKTINENISILYQSYGLNIIWCNPEYPCETLRIQMYEACKYPNVLNKLSLGGKRLGTNLAFQTLQTGLDKYQGCTALRNMLDVCMEEHMRAEFARRWMESHSFVTPSPYLKMKPIDMWSMYMKK